MPPVSDAGPAGRDAVPALSVVLITPDSFETIHRTTMHAAHEEMAELEWHRTQHTRRRPATTS
jgi:hypothetical protein